MPTAAKLIEKVILQNLRFRLSDCLGEHQFGIRNQSSTTHAVVMAYDALTRSADDLQIGASVFISFDYSKAFDRINHGDLLKMFRSCGLPTGFCLFLKDYLRDWQQRVQMCGYTSGLKPVTSGVPQGSLIGPYLFGVYVSSLKPLHSSTVMIKFVDDICIITVVRRKHAQHDIDNINSEISSISNWSSIHNMKLNSTKTSGFIHYRGLFGNGFNIESMIQSVKFKDSVRFLGVILESDLKWSGHVKLIERKCSQRMYILRRIKSFTSNEEFLMIFNGLVISLIEYACPAFVGLTNRQSFSLDRIQRRCLRIKGITAPEDLSLRRSRFSLKVLRDITEAKTVIRFLVPDLLPSGRTSVPYCRTSLRRNSFLPAVCILSSSAFHD